MNTKNFRIFTKEIVRTQRSLVIGSDSNEILKQMDLILANIFTDTHREFIRENLILFIKSKLTLNLQR